MYGNLWVHRFAVFTCFMTFLLLCAGALVTGTGSGLAVPDWPLSFGQYMPPMVGGVFFEHGHRLIAGTVGILTVLLSLALWFSEPRLWVRLLSVFAVVAVIAQALLGGLTVLYRLPVSVSVTHACLAQIFFSMTLVMALVTSPSWHRPMYAAEEGNSWLSLPALALMTSIGFFFQLLLGAIMRHNGAGLAIPDFPLAFGKVLPPAFTFPVTIHFAHRVGAVVMAVLSLVTVYRVMTRHMDDLRLTTFAGVMAASVAFQVMLGASIIWMKRPVPITTAHLAVGALCLASSISLSVLAFRRFGYGLRMPELTSWVRGLTPEPGGA